ncbi:MAG: hypothetical protein DWG74_02020 [Chloroflexi bacterium]|nr:hypothetical protein [Chloroflexota bacterium]
MALMRGRLALAGFVVLVIVAAIAFVIFLTRSGPTVPTSGDLDAQALAIERQLLCPQCTNERLDVCTLAICNDMKSLIRSRLEAGAPPDDIVLYFRNRYGDRILRQIPREGFNLVLFGWVGGSLALVALAGGAFLYRLRRPAAARPAADDTGSPADEHWLDAEIEREP